ncbi:linoleate 13S-lipoxygenase 2-1 chloroplastic-like [Tripterygium wilfordii]|uniref:Lipoxygenase n=3 Tax=Pentapetalae TaxID=1437201 RepID=A0A7J7DQY7_TRIWF|nr:linoleate 13S-lipoxygenase 2-1 chloroplastic-like [Tripterygium wilfordii]
MLKPQVPHPHQSHLLTARNLFPCNIPKLFNIHGNIDHNQHVSSSSSFPTHHSILFSVNKSLPLKNLTTNALAGGDTVEALAEECIKVKATVTVTQTLGGLLSSIGIERGLDDLNDLLGKSLLLELVSADLDPKTGLEKETIKGFAHRASKNGKDVTYECEFEVTGEFGEVGAIFVENEHHKEMYLKVIVLDGLPNGPVNVTCDSWVHSKFDNPHKRVFFTHKSYLPSQTPNGLKRLRDEELIMLQGDGRGERKKGDRIYDYDVYNDIGDPDKGEAKARPVLGGKDHPYPRRCRTGRPRCEKDPSAEKRSTTFYVPRDEAFAEIKQLTFSAKTLYSGLHALVPSLETVIDSNLGFHLFSNIDSLFNEGIHLPPLQEQRKGFWGTVMPRLVKAVTGGTDLFLCFETPETMIRDRFFWFRDVEFSRQTLAGLNPYSIQLVKEWPLKSKLDPDIYGPPESAITTELIELEINGFMTVDKAIQQKKLFIIDYHDILLPFVSRVRELEGTTLYGSRALFFLTPDGTLKSLAIELTRPPMDGKPQWKQVFTPAWHSTGCWLWRLAKAHFLAHDAGYHQLVSHWLRTHCATEPYIIATNRQLSVMHPIYRLLHPHFRYTMEINALARQALINVDGIIETSFSLGKYSGEISSAAYDQQWRFDCEGLPKDLIRRGLAVEDLTAPHGLSLTIEDYPFANDGLLIWDAIQTWVSDYVKHYYPNASSIDSDAEIQAWWTEIRTVGHADKQDEPWWPKLETPHDLIEILTTMIWVTSGHHAAVNFGQYVYAGYFPNRPTIARVNMPNEDPTNEQWKSFLNKPAVQLLKTFPSRIQATRVMAVLDILSTHSPDEEYLGEFMEKSWSEDPIINAAFERFNGRLRQIEGIIDERNANEDLKNRHGAGVMPYELLKPFSEPGVTGKGVPYSISI